MSTPTMTRADYDAQVVTALDDSALPPSFSATVGMRLERLLGIASELKAAGYPIGDSIDRAQTIKAAAREAIYPTNGPGWRLDPSTILDLSPQQAADIARATAADALSTNIVNARTASEEAFDAALLPAVSAAFREETRAALAKMSEDFDAALETIHKAHRAKLTPTTTGDQILTNGSTAQVAAYRDLGPAVTALNRLAALRIRLCNIAGLGPARHVIACLVTGTRDLDGAASVYTGQDRTVLVESGHVSAAPFARKLPAPRLGGPWLALITAGYTPHLNTADEADALAANRNKEN